MPRTATLGTLTKLLDQSSRPIYVVDTERRIVYCNPALAAWLDLERRELSAALWNTIPRPRTKLRIVRDAEAPLAELCPPPRALSGEPCMGTISCLARGGSLVHRQAEFMPLDAFSRLKPTTGNRIAALVIPRRCSCCWLQVI